MSSLDPVRPVSPRRRLTLQARLMLGFAILSSCALVFCCVPLLVWQFLFGPSETRDPAAVEAAALTIAPLVIPRDFAGTVALTAENSVYHLTIARFDHKEGRGRMVIGRSHWPFGDTAESESARLRFLVDQLFPGQRSIDAQAQVRTVKIDGRSLPFYFLEGEDRASTTRMKQVSGEFYGPRGAIQVLLQVESDFLTDEALNEFIASVARSADIQEALKPATPEK